MNKKNIYWQKIWRDLSKKDDFSAMGRSSYNINNFFEYSINSINNLSPINKNTIFLDCGCGSGLFSWFIHPFVKKIFLIDFNKEMVGLAKKRFGNNNKVKIFVKDIRNIKFNEKIKFNRIIFGSVLQYLNDYSEVDNVFYNLKKISQNNVKILFTQNPDIAKKKSHIVTYKKLKWKKKKLNKSLINEEKRFWIDYKKIKIIANQNGFKVEKKIKISKNLYGSSHMFDFLLYR